MTHGCGTLTTPKWPCVVSIVTPYITKGRTEMFKFDVWTHHLRSCSSIRQPPQCFMLESSAILIYLSFIQSAYKARVMWIQWKFFNSLAPWRFEWNFRDVMFKLISVIHDRSIAREIALRWLSLVLTDGKSTFVQVMAWCHQATSHYLSQCWPRFMSPYGITRP